MIYRTTWTVSSMGMLTLFIIYIIQPVEAYVEPEYYDGILIKNYDPDFNTTRLKQDLSLLQPYYEGVKFIHIFPELKACRLPDGEKAAIYWFFQRSIRFCEYDVYILIHELAHHKNNQDGYTWIESGKHGKVFEEAEEEIEAYYYETYKTNKTGNVEKWHLDY